MRYLSGEEERKALEYMQIAKNIALESVCLRAKCGSVIVKDNEIIGVGYNSPPLNKCIEECVKDSLPDSFKSDKTCCVHAEQRAIMNSLAQSSEKLQDSTIYFARLNENNEIAFADKPYCTICSKMCLDEGIAEFALYQFEGIIVYNMEEFNTLSFEHNKLIPLKSLP